MAIVMSSSLKAPRNCHPLQIHPEVKRRRIVTENPISDTNLIIQPILAPLKPTQVINTSPQLINNGLYAAEDLYMDFPFARSQVLYFAWREVEAQLPVNVFNLSFDETFGLEKARITGVEYIFNYIQQKQMSHTTLHLAAHFMNRLFLYNDQHQCKNDIPPQWATTAIATAIRSAVKMEETPENTDDFRNCPHLLWKSSNMPLTCPIDKSINLVNQMEKLHLKILGHHPVNVPVASDFLEQYIRVGEWPDILASEYRNLGQFLLALSLFATGRTNTLKGKIPSQVAAGALVLSIKIMNANKDCTAYEFWPDKLETFTQYSLKDLQPVVQSLSRLLRSRQKKGTECLCKMFPYWALFNWT